LKLILPTTYFGQLSSNTITKEIISISTAGYNGVTNP
jgi:hypothetical protein